MKLVLVLKQVKQEAVWEAISESLFREGHMPEGDIWAETAKPTDDPCEGQAWEEWKLGGCQAEVPSKYRDTRRYGLSPGQIRTWWHWCPQLSIPSYMPDPGPSSHKESLFPWGHGSKYFHNASFSASVAFRCFLSGVDFWLSGALGAKDGGADPQWSYLTLWLKLARISLFPSLIIYLFAFSEGVTVPRASLASN